jgi:hypothetical protein
MSDKGSNHSLLASVARTPEHVVYRSFVNETVLLNLESGRYFGVNPTGGRMLEELVNAGTVGEALERLSAHYGRPQDEIETDLQVFCDDLTSRGLLELRPSGGA